MTSPSRAVRRDGAGGRGRVVLEVDKATRRPLRAYGSVSEAALLNSV